MTDLMGDAWKKKQKNTGKRIHCASNKTKGLQVDVQKDAFESRRDWHTPFPIGSGLAASVGEEQFTR